MCVYAYDVLQVDVMFTDETLCLRVCLRVCIYLCMCVYTGIVSQVDVMFTDETFRLAPIGAQAPDGAQFLFVTATLPQVKQNSAL